MKGYGNKSTGKEDMSSGKAIHTAHSYGVGYNTKSKGGSKNAPIGIMDMGEKKGNKCIPPTNMSM